MTREEAREALSLLKIFDAPLLREAVDMAIEALSEPKIIVGIDTPYGSDMGIATLFKGKDDKLILEDIKEIMAVVRCKDCRWWNEDDFPMAFPEKKISACEVPNIYGANFSRYTQEDEFCSRGERKGGDDE